MVLLIHLAFCSADDKKQPTMALNEVIFYTSSPYAAHQRANKSYNVQSVCTASVLSFCSMNCSTVYESNNTHCLQDTNLVYAPKCHYVVLFV